jgi:phage tail-like protein
MATLRNQFNVLVHLGDGVTPGPHAGFQEVSGISLKATVVDYRTGDDNPDGIRKITGMNKATDVTLKRGVIGSHDFHQWLNQIRAGDHGASRTVTIQLQNKDRTAIVARWKLRRARIIKHTSGPMNAKGTDVAMEELVLSFERLDVE